MGGTCSRPLLLMSKCQKFCKIHMWQWWLKVIRVRNSRASCCRLQMCWILHLSLPLGSQGFTSCEYLTTGFLIERQKKNAISCSFLRLFQNVEVFHATLQILSAAERELLEDIELSPRNTGSGFHVCTFGDLFSSALAHCATTHATLLQLKVSVLSTLI